MFSGDFCATDYIGRGRMNYGLMKVVAGGDIFEVRYPAPIVEKRESIGNAIAKIKPYFSDCRITVEELQVQDQKAKHFLVTNLAKIDASVEFIQSSIPACPKLVDIQICKDLNPNIFSWEAVQSVRDDIIKEGKQDDNVSIIYAVESRFNGCITNERYLPWPGRALFDYENAKQKSREIEVQLAFDPLQAEILLGSANMGYHGLCYVLNEHTKGACDAGMLSPYSNQMQEVVQRLQTRGVSIEYICIASKPIDGVKRIHHILVPAAALGKFNKDKNPCSEMREEMQFLCALHGFRAQFQKTQNQSSFSTKVILKTVGAGLDDLGNDPTILAKAFYKASKEYEEGFSRWNIIIRLQIMVKENVDVTKLPAYQMVQMLGLQQYKE